MIVETGLLCLMLVTLSKCQQPVHMSKSNLMPPKVSAVLRALRPRGLRAYITADVENTNLVYFDGIIYDNFDSAVNYSPNNSFIRGSAGKQADGKWMFEDLNVNLTEGLFIRYVIFIPDQLPEKTDKGGRTSLIFTAATADLVNDNLFYVTELEDPSAPPPYCKPTVTKVRGRQVCAGDVIFEDNFDTLREDVWQIEQYIPIDHPEHPFVSYQRISDRNVFVENGNLHIVPKLQDDLMRDFYHSIETGTLDLTDGCTRSECSKVAFGPDILPPVASGRLTSIAFAFTYGEVYIRAKIPRGDWLYPELLLIPLVKKYVGEKEMARILKVVRISDVLTGFQNFSGWNVDQRCYNAGPHNLTEYLREGGTDEFHEFVLIWRPYSIKLGLDDVFYMDSNVWWADPCYKDIDSSSRSSLQDYRQLSLGVAAGGTVFPDSIITDYGDPKPWRNGDSKASLKFWQNKPQWLPTWTAPSLVIDYIKVVAL